MTPINEQLGPIDQVGGGVGLGPAVSNETTAEAKL